MKNLSATSPASDDSPMQIRRQLRKKDPIIRKKLSAAGKQAKTTSRIGEGRHPSTAQASDHPSHNSPTTTAALTRGRSPRERHDTRSQHAVWTSRMVACTTTHFLKYRGVRVTTRVGLRRLGHRATIWGDDPGNDLGADAGEDSGEDPGEHLGADLGGDPDRPGV